MATYTEADILAQLDQTSEDMDFPDLGNGSLIPLAVRLHAYRDDARWALVIEVAGFSYRPAQVFDIPHVFGNCIEGPPGPSEDGFLDRVSNAQELRDAAEDVGVTDPVVAVGDQRIVVPGTFTDADTLFYAFGDTAGRLLLADDDELRARIPRDLPLLLTLDEWRHPDLIDEVPSTSPTFQLIARALVTGDPGSYAPTREPNTHWKNWPEAGHM